MLAVCDEYERLSGIPKRMERVFWWPTREWLTYTVEISLGKQDGVCPVTEPDAALVPEKLGGGHGGYRWGESWQCILESLEDEGPGTARELAERLGVTPAIVGARIGEHRDRPDNPVRVIGKLWAASAGQRGGSWAAIYGLPQHPDCVPFAQGRDTFSTSAVYDVLAAARPDYLTRPEIAKRANVGEGTVRGWIDRYAHAVESYDQPAMRPRLWRGQVVYAPVTIRYYRLKEGAK